MARLGREGAAGWSLWWEAGAAPYQMQPVPAGTYGFIWKNIWLHIDHDRILEIKQYTSLPGDMYQNLSTRNYTDKRKTWIKITLDLAVIRELPVMILKILCSFSFSLLSYHYLKGLSKFASLKTSYLLHNHLDLYVFGWLYAKVKDRQFSNWNTNPWDSEIYIK